MASAAVNVSAGAPLLAASRPETTFHRRSACTRVMQPASKPPTVFCVAREVVGVLFKGSLIKGLNPHPARSNQIGHIARGDLQSERMPVKNFIYSVSTFTFST